MALSAADIASLKHLLPWGALPFTITITASTTLTTAQTVVLCDTSGGDIVVTLPAVSGHDGTRYFIKKIDGSGNIVTIDGNGAETIDEVLTKVISTQYDSLEIVCDGSEWWII